MVLGSVALEQRLWEMTADRGKIPLLAANPYFCGNRPTLRADYHFSCLVKRPFALQTRLGRLPAVFVKHYHTETLHMRTVPRSAGRLTLSIPAGADDWLADVLGKALSRALGRGFLNIRSTPQSIIPWLSPQADALLR